jgi:hypothetical protein
MATIQFTVEAALPPQALLRALTDFSPNRPKLWRNIDPALYKVHAVGDHWADVTEGSAFAGGVWERERYDWSTSDLVTATVTDSNSFAAGSYWRYRIMPNTTGGSRVEITVRRIGKGVKGRLVTALVSVFGKGLLRREFGHMLSQLQPTQS